MATSLVIPTKYLSAIVVEGTELPSDLYWYEHGGVTTFPMYGASGNILSAFCAILIERIPLHDVDFGRSGLKQEDGGKWYVVDFYASDDIETMKCKIAKAIEAMTNGN